MSTLASALEIPPIPPYKNRRGWLIAFGVVEVLIACLSLALMVGMLFLPFPAQGAPGAPPPPTSPAAMKAFVVALYGGIGAIFLTLGIGSILCKNWARIAMLAVSGFWLVSGLFSVLGFFLIFPMVRQQSKIPSDVEHSIFVGVIAFMGFILVLLPSVFLIFYSRRSVKATCLAHGTGTTAAQVPVPIVILTIWESFGVLALFGYISIHATVLFGLVVRGWPGFLVLLVFAIVSMVSAWLIYHRDFRGWALALGKTVFWSLSTALSFAGRDLISLYREMGMSDQQLQAIQQFPQFQSMMWIFIVPTMAAYLIFLIYTRKYFPRNP